MGEKSNNTPLRVVVHGNWMVQQSGDGGEMDVREQTHTHTYAHTDSTGALMIVSLDSICLFVCLFVCVCVCVCVCVWLLPWLSSSLSFSFFSCVPTQTLFPYVSFK